MTVNGASYDQMKAVAQSCPGYNPVRNQAQVTSVLNVTSPETISCASCRHWDGKQCAIDLFDKVLTNLDQT